MLIPSLSCEVKENKRLWWLLGIGLSGGGVAVAQAYVFSLIIDEVFIGGQGTGELMP